VKPMPNLTREAGVADLRGARLAPRASLDRLQLQPLAFVLEDVNVGGPMIADQLHKLFRFEQRLLRVRVV
jgi:hypothetical protein